MRRAHPRLAASFAATMACLIAAGCGDPGPTSGPSGAPSVPGSQPAGVQGSATAAASGQPTLDPNDSRAIPGDLFTAPANPLTLTVTAAADAAVTKTIGSAGGSITAKAPDGTTYALAIPANALPFDVPITVTPTTSVSGFPAGATPAHHLGVSLSPDGLQLAKTATLTITAASPLPATGVVAFDYLGDGSEAAFHAYTQAGTTLTMPVEHFSGYTAEYPLNIGGVRQLARDLQTDMERRLASDVQALLDIVRQEQLLGEEPSWTTLQIAQAVLAQYKRLVISPRVAAASRGCQEANDAMAAYLAYQQQRQDMGVGTDPAFDLVGAGTMVPQDLVDLATQLCFKEAYDFCARTGDFPGLLLYYFTVFTHNLDVFGAEPTPENLALAHGYLKRCGHWRVKVAVSTRTDDRVIGHVLTSESTHELFVEWKAGSGPFGLLSSTIEGTGDPEITKWTSTDCDVYIKSAKTATPLTASIDALSFDRYEGPTLTGNAQDPVPLDLVLTVGLGSVRLVWGCHGAMSSLGTVETVEQFSEAYQYAEGDRNMAVSDGSRNLDGTTTMTFHANWQFSAKPHYKAVQVVTGTVRDSYRNPTQVRMEVVVEHEPN